MVKFICKRCGYNFEGKLGYKPRRCPYCSQEAVEEEQDAEEIIKDVERILG